MRITRSTFYFCEQFKISEDGSPPDEKEYTDNESDLSRIYVALANGYYTIGDNIIIAPEQLEVVTKRRPDYTIYKVITKG